ncbi:mitochondrial distribution and morphology protein 34 [Mycena metata]|uniref:Mitochondrial distribution and morphology protein 34 n=1 Tax=Mycena metata TaxID=1033252 RepID=A0AAD7MP84_9AGAR|nr:mitochondrial distribution and morphology protein 34 [Mycena metata]
MSFTFGWPKFSDQFHYDAIQMLNTALNKGNKPPIIADTIEVVELEMGTQPPELEIRDIGDLTMDHFRGIFRLTYAGDAHLVLKTKVQANPLNHKQPDIHLMAGSRGMLAAKQALVVPMLLRLSHFKLSSYVVLVVSKQKGITLVFKTDPLQSVDINSTFDSIAVIQVFIQREIEGQLRQMFREDLPGIIHRLSQQWVRAKVETPTAGLTQQLPHNPFSAAFASPPSPTSSRSTSPSPSHSLSLSTPPSSAYHEPQPLTAHSIHALAMLSHSNHTLSPYTRSLSHFAVRSGPPRPPVVGATPGTARKGRRRRTYRINGGTRPPDISTTTEAPRGAGIHPSEMSPSEFDVGDMDMYFRHMDLDGEPASPIGSRVSANFHSHMQLRHRASSHAMSAG